MFQGFTDETFEFFMAIRFNNNRDFFQSNHDWYVRAVREPGLALAESLSDAVERLDENLERRPNRVLSRINRDLRFTNDKSPYRDYIWLSFRYNGEMHSETPEIYFALSAEGGSLGMGIYGENRPKMDNLRRQLRTAPDEFRACIEPLSPEYPTSLRVFKRMAVPDDVPQDLAAWYPARSFYFEKPLRDFALLKSPDLSDTIREGIERLTPAYRFFRGL